MSKPMVEKYEQMLASDPSSTVFVELARAYLDRGDNERAIAICQQGIIHHPNSVVGRVLWGKALISTGKAADAMKQFDLATNIDRDNPHAYNLIGEALLRKGLYRSALPILRRAAALQPNDGRIAQWLDQARAALSGGPAPVLSDNTSLEMQALVDQAQASGASSQQPRAGPSPTTPPRGLRPDASVPRSNPHGATPARGAPVASLDDPFAAFAPQTDSDGQATVLMSAYGAGPETRPGPPVPTGEMPLIEGVVEHEPGRRTVELPIALGVLEPPDPFASVGSSADEPDTVRGLTSTFDALTSNEPQRPPPGAVGSSEPSVVVSGQEPMPGFSANIPVLAPSSAPNPLVDEAVSAQSEMPTSEFQMVGMNQTPMRSALPAPKASSGGLLDDIPEEHFEPPSSPNLPNVQFNTQATEAIAREYERELREKLEVTKQKKTFWQAHGVKIAAVAVTLVVLGGLGGSFLYTRFKNQGETLDSSKAKGLSAINADTREQYEAAIRALDQSLKMDAENAEALALAGYAHAMLFAEHGGDQADRDAAVAAFANPRARELKPELALIVDYLTADDTSRTAARQQLLGSTMEKSVVQAQAGRMLLAEKNYDEALAHLKKATELDARNVRALVALGEYYLAFEDWDSALDMMSRAESLSKFHPGRVIGQAEARLELDRELPEALADLLGLPQSAAVPEALMGRYMLMLGRAQSANNKHDDALKTLGEAQARFPKMGLDFELALGTAQTSAGLMAQAQKSFEDALKIAPRSEAAKEGLGRVLIARSREKEVIERLRSEKDQKRVALLRGIAFYKLNDPRKARAELQATQVNNKYPAEAAIYLALIDAAEEGQSDKATAQLEKFAGSLRRNKAVVQVALARVYMNRNALDKARALLEEAAKDPQDYEGNALLGELLLKAGVPPDVALDPLLKAVERNSSHAPSRHLLVRTLLALGKYQEATRQVESWQQDNPTLELMWRDTALVDLQTGKIKEAEAAVARAGSDDLELWKLRAVILFARGDGKSGMRALESANKLDSKDAETFCEIGNAWYRQGHESTPAYQAAVREDPKSICGLAGPLHARPVSKGTPNPRQLLEGLIARSQTAWEKGFLLATLARVQLQGNDVKGARQTAAEALQMAPFNPATSFASGEIAKKEKDDARALEAYGKAAELDASWSSARLAYADALVRAGGDSLPKALKQYEAVTQIDENDAEVARAKKAVIAIKKQLSL